MNISIKNINRNLVEEIDALAANKNLSRNAFLKSTLENNIMIGIGELRKMNEVELTSSKILDALLLHNKRMNDLLENYKKLFTLISLASGISPDEVDAVLLEKELRM